jgi:hypothetical protein
MGDVGATLVVAQLADAVPKPGRPRGSPLQWVILSDRPTRATSSTEQSTAAQVMQRNFRKAIDPYGNNGRADSR